MRSTTTMTTPGRGWWCCSDNEPTVDVELKASSEPDLLTVESVDNHVYFYAEVNGDRCLALMKTIRELDNRLRNEHLSRSLPDSHPLTPIWLHVQSYGGSLFTGFSVADQLTTIASPVYSVIEGCCASSATLVAMGCDRRFITPSSFVLIHELSTLTWGKYSDVKDEVRMLDMAMDRLAGFYETKSTMTEKQVREMLGHESWFGADECLKLGFVDEIMGRAT